MTAAFWPPMVTVAGVVVSASGDEGAGSPLAKEVFESFAGFRKKAIAYGRESEGIVHSVRSTALGA